MSSWVDTLVSHTLSYLDVSRDDDPTLDGRPVPLLSIVLGESVDNGGLRVSVELLKDQHAVLYSKARVAPTWNLCTELTRMSTIPGKRCYLSPDYC